MKKHCIKAISGSIFVLMMILVIFASFNVMGYVQVATAETIDEDEPAEPIIYYTGTAAVTSVTETINYSYYTLQQGNVNPYCPQYFNTDSSLSNACAPVGGAIVVGFYDRYCTNLIPNVTPGYTQNGKYRYYGMGTNATAIQAVIGSLYTSMGTNSQGAGTSRAQYQAGLSAYATNAGYSTSFSSVMSNGALDNSAIISQLTSGKLVTLYITNHNLCEATLGSNSATYLIASYTGNHIYIAYRYKLIRYYDANDNNFRTDILLGVSTGLGTSLSGWYYVGYSATTLNDADATYIY